MKIFKKCSRLFLFSMKALIVSYKRGRHLIHPNNALIMIPGVESKTKAQSMVGKKVSYATKSGKIINGIITRPHGAKA